MHDESVGGAMQGGLLVGRHEALTLVALVFVADIYYMYTYSHIDINHMHVSIYTPTYLEVHDESVGGAMQGGLLVGRHEALTFVALVSVAPV